MTILCADVIAARLIGVGAEEEEEYKEAPEGVVGDWGTQASKRIEEFLVLLRYGNACKTWQQPNEPLLISWGSLPVSDHGLSDRVLSVYGLGVAVSARGWRIH